MGSPRVAGGGLGRSPKLVRLRSPKLMKPRSPKLMN